MSLIAIIGGTGLTEFPELDIKRVHSQVETAFGKPSDDIVEGELHGQRLLFLPRHGKNHAVAPHKINYRANLLALQSLGADSMIAVNAVGGIHCDAIAGHISVPDQIVDYTHGRENTYFDGEFRPLDHVEFSYPYDEILRQKLIKVLSVHHLSHGFSKSGVYGVTQGPRLETIAEIKRLENDGCDLVGMTGMPEAVLARELSIPYASLCLVVNAAAGKTDALITIEEIRSVLNCGMRQIKSIIADFCKTSP